MSNYTKTTDFDVKDSLPSGDTGKIIRGSEFEVEFENIEVAIASKADSLNTVLTGNTSATNLSVTGNTTLGNAATDTVTVNADFSSDLLPSADATYDLGAPGSEWQDLYITGTANIDSLVAGTFTSVGIDDTTTIGNALTLTTLAAGTGNQRGAAIINNSGSTGGASLTVGGGIAATTLFGSGGSVSFYDTADNRSGFIIADIGSLRISSNDFSSKVEIANSGTTVTGDLAVDTDTLFVDVSADKVGVNTSSPSEALEINGNLKFSDGAARTIEGALNQNLIINSLGNLTGEGVDLRVNGTSVLLADFTGNVGVGTVAPTFKLTVEDEAAILSSSSGGSSTLVIGSGQNSQDSIQSVQFRDRFGTTGFPDGQVGAYVQMERQSTNARYDLTFGTISSSTEDAAERMRITDTGNVGIGTSSPASLVASGSSPILSIGGTDSGLTTGEKAGSLSFITNDTSYTATYADGITGEIVSVSETAVGGGYGLAFYTGVTTDTDRAERVRIDMRGNVGIGTDAPEAALDVSGDFILRDTGFPRMTFIDSDGTNTRTFLDHSSGTFSITAQNDTANGAIDFKAFDGSTTKTRMSINSTGNVGIGTTSPGEKLAVHGASGNLVGIFETTTGNTNRLWLGAEDTESYIDATAGTGATNMVLKVASTERMRIDGNGRVGIGTDAPSRHLDIEDTTSNPFISLVGSTTSVPGLLFGDTDSDSIGQIRYDNSDNSMEFTAGNVMSLRIQSDGNVLIGKTVKQTQTSGLDVEQLTSTDGDGALGLKSGTSTTTGNAFINCFLQNGVGSGRIEANGANALGFGAFSDLALKENIEDLPPQLANVMQLRPVEFDYKDGSGHQIGFIAQEVEQVWPDLVSGEEGLKSIVGLGKTEARLIKALQEQQIIIEDLKARIATLEAN